MSGSKQWSRWWWRGRVGVAGGSLLGTAASESGVQEYSLQWMAPNRIHKARVAGSVWY
jgi:hypothetical protein